VLGAAVGSLKGATDARSTWPESARRSRSRSGAGITGAEPDLRAVVDFGWLGIIARRCSCGSSGCTATSLRTGLGNPPPDAGHQRALLPLRLTQMKSMLKMQRVAPQIKSIQEKYKKYSLRDPRKAEMNQEISASTNRKA